MSELDNILNQYAFFEARVGDLMTSLCASHCSDCTTVCCKCDFCQETIDSPFLSLMHERFLPSIPYSAEHGWLTNKGCGLWVGRPPVCYEFLCNDIIIAQASDMGRYAIKVLAQLVSHIGKNALGSRHIVEIMSADKLGRVTCSRFEKRLTEAENALAEIRIFFEENIVGHEVVPIFSKIIPPPLTRLKNLLYNPCES